MKYLLFGLVFLTFSCVKQQSILICGDHICVNKAEAKQYFEENLTLEVQIISDSKKNSYDLVDLNIEGEKPDIKVFKSKNKRIVKKLSKKQIKEKKIEVEKKRKKSKLETKKTNKKPIYKKKIQKEEISTSKSEKLSIDICLKLKKCDIDSITNYLIKVSNEKDFPNISLRE